jgi:hypothetical protein
MQPHKGIYWREVVSARGDLEITLFINGRYLTRHYTIEQLTTPRAAQYALRAIKDSMEREIADVNSGHE